MACGEISPHSKTPAPRRVTSRSSCKVFKWCAATLAIFSLQELEPISMAAKVNIRGAAPENWLCGQDTRPGRGEAVMKVEEAVEQRSTAEKIAGFPWNFLTCHCITGYEELRMEP